MPPKMHSLIRQEFGAFTLKTLNAAVLSAMVFSNVNAAGLGKLTVLSALGQPLRAEIELTAVSKDEAGAFSAKMASAEAFRQAGIEYSPVLSLLRFSVEQRGERPFIRVTSTQPVNEPFVDMLLELSSSNGRLVREYTFLLDPSDLRTTQTAQVVPVPAQETLPTRMQRPEEDSVLAPSSVPHAPATRHQPQKSVPVQNVAPVAQAANHPGEYRIKSGDSLAQIANKVRGSVSLDQMLVALFQANPDAFASNNMNRLKAGQVLVVPSAETARSISTPEARAIVVAQAADFNAYRGKLAGQVATAAPQKSVESKQAAGGKITAKVEEKPTPANEAKDKLKLSNAGANTARGDDKAGGPTEDKIVKEKALAEANARVKELEKNVSELQKVLELKNKNLAEQQKRAESSQAKTNPAPSATISPPVPVAQAPKSTKPVEPVASKPASPAPAASASSQASVPAKPQPAPIAPPPEPSLVDELLGNSFVLPGLGALLVALGGLGIYSAHRKKQGKQFEDSLITDSNLKANSLFGSTGGQSVDTNNSVFNSSFSPSISQLDSNEVDPVAEADVYIAYGRDAQAEEILKEALRTQPDRHAVRVKLLEIYSNRKDLKAFEVLATELYGLTKGEGPEWDQAVALGAALDPKNPLYGGGKDGNRPKEAGGTGLVAPTQPLDEQGLAALLSSTQPDDLIGGAADLHKTANASYGDSAEPASQLPAEPASDMLPEVGGQIESESAKSSSSNDLDFDLEGMNIPDTGAPKVEPVPASDLGTDLASIDFNFLDEPASPAKPQAETASSPAVEAEPLQVAGQDSSLMMEPIPTPSSEVQPPADPVMEKISPLADLDLSLPAASSESQDAQSDTAAEMSSLDIDIPDLPEEASAPVLSEDVKPKAESNADPLDFDLSDISLELNSSASTNALPDLAPDQPGHTVMELSSSEAEMATKLDLAIAYQEIGDREGARELLDEVLKGGSPEQSEKARALLLELA